MGEEELRACLTELGEEMAGGFEYRITQHPAYSDRLQEAVAIMSELGYDTRINQTSENEVEIIANNCVFQELAQQHEEFCKLDISFLTNLLKTDIEHTECIVRNGKYCRFKITNTTQHHSV
ncbi:methanogen output domain 1-containing protein [Nitrosomonas sp.]|uniref:methanogen output domain 1-containing protein n=1 Tax=Nitrosomonas sp. TaxID=42353 RepID=UPI002B403C50|nr:methanogen output domain 1-containing protein [Nitrosomonas sp.]